MQIEVSPGVFFSLDTLLVWMVVISVLSVLAAKATRDMNRRGAPGWIFGALVAFVLPLGLAVWAIAATLAADGDGSNGERASRPPPGGSHLPPPPAQA